MANASCIAKTSEAGEEEVLVTTDGTAERSAESVLVVRGRRGTHALVESGRVEVSVTEELKDRAMEVIGKYPLT